MGRSAANRTEAVCLSLINMGLDMSDRYRLFQNFARGGSFYLQDNVTHKQESLRTKDKTTAERLLHARNEAARQPAINRTIALAYLKAADPKMVTRTWHQVMDAILEQKHGETLRRWKTAIKDPAFDCIRQRPIIETTAEELIRLVTKGTVSTNVYIRRIHNFALEMDWLLKSIVPKRQWPKVVHRPGKAIKLAEHLRIIEREQNPERKRFYELAWHLGAAQTDLACLFAEDIDWGHRTISYSRKKLAGRNVDPATIRFGDEVAAILKSLPQHGPLFPYLRTVRPSDRATEFRQRCQGLGIQGVTLHGYRYAWAQRAADAGYPERWAQQALGHGSRRSTAPIPGRRKLKCRRRRRGSKKSKKKHAKRLRVKPSRWILRVLHLRNVKITSLPKARHPSYAAALATALPLGSPSGDAASTFRQRTRARVALSRKARS